MTAVAIEAPTGKDSLHVVSRMWDVWEEERAVIFAPPPKLTVSEWADRHRVVPSYSAEPGKWVTEKTPYLREIMDAFSDPAINRVVFMKCARIGATEAGLNEIGYFIEQDPSPIFIVQPTVDDAKDFSKEQLTPSIEESATLRARVSEATSRDSGNTILAKIFPGGALYLVGANSPRGFRRRTARVVVLEEVDGYPPSAGTEGDQVKLAERRATTFQHRRKVYINSTPTLKGLSRIESEYENSDQRRYFVPCPDCGHEQIFTWTHLKWDQGKPATAAYMCEGCGVLIPEREKFQMVQRGRWMATNPGPLTAGFHINALYSPWVSWRELAEEWGDAQGDATKLQVFVNTALGESWEDRGGALEPATLEARKERYAAEVPAGVGLLTAGADTQADRVEMVVRGWGHGEESWLIAHTVYFGDPGQPAVWQQVYADLFRDYRGENGKVLRIAAACFDSGHHTDAVYKFVKPLYAHRVYAVKGSSTPGAPLLGRRPSVNNKARVRLFLIGTDAAKDAIYSRLKVSQPGPLYMHIPDWTTEDYFAQVTAEKVVRKQINGRWRRTYELPRGARNEALDCEVYALAALHLAPVRREQLGALAQKATVEPPKPVEPTPEPPVGSLEQVVATVAPRQAARRVRSGYVNAWRNR